MDYSRTLVLACATVIEEMLPLMPPEIKHKTLEFGLHVYPAKLCEALQAEIDAVGDDIDTILLGYGLCSKAVVGLNSRRFTLVVPKVDDCIGIFLGSKKDYLARQYSHPGTYFLTKGWIIAGETPFTEYDRMVERIGQAKADRIQKIMLGNYKCLALIDTGMYEMDPYREYSQKLAERFNLRFEEIPGSNRMVKMLLEGDWADEFVVIPPGESIRLGHFYAFEEPKA